MDKGSLTDEVVIEDQLSGGLEVAASKVDNFAEHFEGAMKATLVGAAAAVTAIAGITAAITALGVHGADVNDVESTIVKFAGSADEARVLVDAMAEGTQHTVDKFIL